MDANGIMRYGRLSQDKPDTTVYYSEYSQRICWDNSNIPVSNKTLSQYTGLKDKNGKEIWEGDVVAESMRTDVVTYNLSGFIPFAFADFGDEAYSAIDCEVIGNIYENPELIT